MLGWGAFSDCADAATSLLPAPSLLVDTEEVVPTVLPPDVVSGDLKGAWSLDSDAVPVLSLRKGGRNTGVFFAGFLAGVPDSVLLLFTVDG